ncbi:hypothetical protein N7501_009638 [Penicillium viridicatum]|nr:hypothetical protein N7501_009638 [Penicillium viridicatum]
MRRSRSTRLSPTWT